MWLRGTMPRLRYDQFMRLGWKVLIPFSLVWILALAGVRVMQNSRLSQTSKVVIIVAVVLRARGAVPAGQGEARSRQAGGQPSPGRAASRCRRWI